MAVGESAGTLALFGVLIPLNHVKIPEPSRISTVDFIILDDLVKLVVHLDGAHAVLIESPQIPKFRLLRLLPVNQLLNRLNLSMHGLILKLSRSICWAGVDLDCEWSSLNQHRMVNLLCFILSF